MNPADIQSQIDLLLLKRDYNDILKVLTPSLLAQLNSPYYNIVEYLCKVLSDVTELHLLSVEKYTQSLTNIRDQFNYSPNSQNLLDLESVKYQLLEFVDTDDVIAIERYIFETELRYESVCQYLQNFSSMAKTQIFRRMSLLETALKLILNPKQRNSRTFNNKDEILKFFQFFYQFINDIKDNRQYFEILRRPLKQIFVIIVNFVFCDAQSKPIIPEEFFSFLNRILPFDSITTDFMSLDVQITILYTLGKVILPLIDGPGVFKPQSVYQLLKLIVKSKLEQDQKKLENWECLFQYISILILSLIKKKMQHQFTQNSPEQRIKEKPRLPFIDQLWYHASINFTQKSIKIKHVMKRIISQKYFGLLNLYCMKTGKQNLQTKILEELMITPFEDDILRLKVCINLYHIEEYSKLHQLVQSLLASEKLKDHPFRQVIIDLCGVFTGTYLGKPEKEGLCFARLNLQEYDQLSQQAQKQSILKYDTIVAHVGYSYYNLARNSRFVMEQNNFYAKAIEYLEKSLLINRNNFLVHYNLSKLFANLGRIDEALTFVKTACSLNKGDMNSLILCSLLYSAKDENQKSLMIVDQLLQDNNSKPILYLIRASILSERYLLNLSRDKEIIASEKFGPELKNQIIKKHQKSKDAQNILSQLQKALQGIARQVSERDQKENFIGELIQLKTLQGIDIDPMTYISYRNCLLHSIELLIKIEFFEEARQVIDLIDDGTSINQIEKLYYKGLIAEKQGKIEEACFIYEEILKDDFYHVKTMCNLALVYLKNFPRVSQKIQRANELLIVASKFEVSQMVCFGFALLNQVQGNLEQSNEYLLKSLMIAKSQPVISVTLVPDKLFYIS